MGYRTARPRVTAKAEREPVRDIVLGSPIISTSPGVLIELSFDLHDHEYAVRLLEGVVAEIRAQVEEVR